MDITILICAIALILAAILVLWQAKALARCDLICKSCGTKQNLPWKRLVFRTHVGNDWQLIVRSADAKRGLPHERGDSNGVSAEL
ncbi:MAG: hypothetical protein ACLUDF_05215 [Butyricicoccus sp.]